MFAALSMTEEEFVQTVMREAGGRKTLNSVDKDDLAEWARLGYRAHGNRMSQADKVTMEKLRSKFIQKTAVIYNSVIDVVLDVRLGYTTEPVESAPSAGVALAVTSGVKR